MSLADELIKLEQLRRQGVLSDDEFARAKAAVLAGESPSAPAPANPDQRLTDQPIPSAPAGPLAALASLPPELDLTVSALPQELRDRVRGELRAGERLLWIGQPLPGRAFWSALPIILFAIPWTAFAVFWVASAVWMTGRAPGGGIGALFSCFPLFGVPFILIGLAMLSTPLWAWRQAAHTCYALTDQRAILWEGRWYSGAEVRSYGPPDLTRLVRIERSDGSGDLVFEELLSLTYNKGRMANTTSQRGFLNIAHVRGVESLLRRALLGEPGDIDSPLRNIQFR